MTEVRQAHLLWKGRELPTHTVKHIFKKREIRSDRFIM